MGAAVGADEGTDRGASGDAASSAAGGEAVSVVPLKSITVKGRSIDTVTINVEPSDTIDNVKAKFQEATTQPEATQRLSFGKVVLEVGTLAEHNIIDKAVLVLTKAKRKGK